MFLAMIYSKSPCINVFQSRFFIKKRVVFWYNFLSEHRKCQHCIIDGVAAAEIMTAFTWERFGNGTALKKK